MNSKRQTNMRWLTLIFAVLLAGFSSQVHAQSLQLSKKADFTSNDGIFSFSDVLHARVTAPQIDYLDIKDNAFRLKPVFGNDDNDAEGALTNNLDGTYETHIPLSGLDRSASLWEFRVEIRDDKGVRFETRVTITIQDVPGAGDSLIVIGRIDSLGTNFFRLSGNTVFVDSSTTIQEGGQPLAFGDLRDRWKVSVVAERRSDRLFWALRIDVLQRDISNQEVETRGIIASIDSNSLVVNNIRFVFSGATQFLDENNNSTTRARFQVGMLVEAKGRLDAAGNVIAERIKLEDNNIGNDEIELLGKIIAIEADSMRSLINVGGTLFEVDGNTELLGFDNEPIKLSALRVGELVEVKARTRAGQIPLAERIKREDNNGDELEIKGTILTLTDSSLTVGQFTFNVTANTIVLDNDNNFIRFSDLRSGLLVEVRANLIAGGYFATRIKIEDRNNDEIELKGFVENLTSNSATIAGMVFSVDSSTVILDSDNNPIGFGELRVGMLVEVRADVMVDGSLRANRIKIEDFLQDEIELRGAITAIGGDSLTVTGITFYTSASTQITDNSGTPIDFSALAIGMIVEIRADLQNGVWVASRIRIEDRIDAIVEIRGKIEQIFKNGTGPLSNLFIVLSRQIVVTNATVILDNQNQPIPFTSLNAGDFVEVKARLFADSLLFALRVKKEDIGNDEVEVTGSISALSFTAISVGGENFAIDGTTIFLNNDQQPITIEDLYLGMVVEVKGQRQSDGTLLAVRVKVEDRRAITGFITAVSGTAVSVQGIAHNLTDKSVISDAQNRQISAQSLKVDQLVEVVAQSNQSQQEVVTLRVVLENTSTAVATGASNVPAAFRLMQNYPNPFNPSTVIRFVLPEAGAAQLAVYDLLGRRIRMLTEGVRSAGEHQIVWDGRDSFGQPVASGVYFYRLEAGGFSQTRKLTLTR